MTVDRSLPGSASLPRGTITYVHVLSVDLGTSNTVAVLIAHGRQPRVVEVDGSVTMPSAVYALEDGTIVVGRDAERRARLDPSRFEPNPKRRVDEQQLLLGDRVVSVVDTTAAVLFRVGQETARQLGGRMPDEVRLTHPAQWGQLRRNVLVQAANAAGLGRNLLLVPEPVAAAAHFASFPGKALAPGYSLRGTRSRCTTSERAPSTVPSSGPPRTAPPSWPTPGSAISVAWTWTRRCSNTSARGSRSTSRAAGNGCCGRRPPATVARSERCVRTSARRRRRFPGIRRPTCRCTVDGKPIASKLAADLRSSRDANKLAGYFEKHVMPGS